MKENNHRPAPFRPAVTPSKGFAPNILPGTRPTDLSLGKCNSCSNHNFYPVFQVRMASPLQTENGQPTMVQFPVGFACSACGKLNPFGEEKKEEPKGGDLSINTAEDVKSKERIG